MINNIIGGFFILLTGAFGIALVLKVIENINIED